MITAVNDLRQSENAFYVDVNKDVFENFIISHDINKLDIDTYTDRYKFTSYMDPEFDMSKNPRDYITAIKIVSLTDEDDAQYIIKTEYLDSKCQGVH